MAEITSIETARKKRKKIRRIRRWVVAGLLLLAVCVLVINKDALLNLQLDQVMDSGLSQEAENQSFPINLPGANFYQMEGVGNHLALLTDSRIYFYDNNGKQISSFQHGLASPHAAVSSQSVGVYEEGGTQVELFSPGNSQSSVLTTDASILSVSLSQQGKICVIQAGQRYTSELVVYDHNREELFRWSSQHVMIDACFIGEDRIAAICLSTTGGAMTSSVYFYSLQEETPYAEFSYQENMLISLDAKSDGSVVAIGDQAAVAFDNHGEQVKLQDYSQEGLSYFDNSSDIVILVFGDYTKYKTNDITFYDTSLSALTTYTSQKRITTEKKGAVLMEDNLLLFEKENSMLTLYEVDNSSMEISFVEETPLLRNDKQILKESFSKGDGTDISRDESSESGKE